MVENWDDAALIAHTDRELARQARRDWMTSLAIIGPMVALTAFFGVLAWLT